MEFYVPSSLNFGTLRNVERYFTVRKYLTLKRKRHDSVTVNLSLMKAPGKAIVVLIVCNVEGPLLFGIFQICKNCIMHGITVCLKFSAKI